MTDALTYTVPGRPVSWQRKNVVRGRVMTDAKQRSAKRAIQWATRAAMAAARGREPSGFGWALGLDPDAAALFSVEVAAYYPSRVMGDADRIPGLFLDAMEGLVYATDRQVSDLVVRRRVDAANPRVEVTVVRLERDPVEPKRRAKRAAPGAVKPRATKKAASALTSAGQQEEAPEGAWLRCDRCKFAHCQCGMALTEAAREANRRAGIPEEMP